MPKNNKRKNFYAIKKGRKPGIYTNWPEAEAQVKGFPGAVYQGFRTQAEAQVFLDYNTKAKPFFENLGKDDTKKPEFVPPAKFSGAKRKFIGGGGLEHDETVTNVNGTIIGRDGFNFFQGDDCVVQPIDTITIHFDGGSRGNPGKAGAGCELLYVNVNDETVKVHMRKYVGEKATCNQAEYEGLLLGLAKLDSLSTQNKLPRIIKEAVIYGDSKLVVQQMGGSWKCNKDTIRPLYNRAHQIVSNLRQSRSLKLKFQHIYRDKNMIADGLANEAMNASRTWETESVIRKQQSILKNNNDGNQKTTRTYTATTATGKKQKSSWV